MGKLRHSNKTSWWRLNKYWYGKGSKPWLFSTKEISLIYLRTIHIVRHPHLQITKNPFVDQGYFNDRKLKIQIINAA
jgi:hypothetical protein